VIGTGSLISLMKIEFVLQKMPLRFYRITVRTGPAHRVEGPDGEPAARKGATLVAVQREEPRGQLRERAWVRVGSRIRRAVRELGERGGEEIMARAADTDEIDLRLRHRVRELAGLRVGGSRHAARQVLDRCRGRGVGENRLV
jgi:hypothetical protein